MTKDTLKVKDITMKAHIRSIKFLKYLSNCVMWHTVLYMQNVLPSYCTFHGISQKNYIQKSPKADIWLCEIFKV